MGLKKRVAKKIKPSKPKTDKKSEVKVYNLTQNTVLWFGKYKGKKVRDIITSNPQYIAWLLTLPNYKFHREIKAKVTKATEHIKAPKPNWDYDEYDENYDPMETDAWDSLYFDIHY